MIKPSNIPPERAAIEDCWNKVGVWGKSDCPELTRHIHCRNCPVYSAAAVNMLDSELPAHYIEEWTAHFARAKELTEANTHSVVIFRIHAEWFALPTSIFMEVCDLRPIHTLPHGRARTVLGLVNVRGELLICVSLAALLGLEPMPGTLQKKQHAKQDRLMVVTREGSRFVFPVQEVHGVHRFHPQDAQEAPATLARTAGTYSRGVLDWQNKSVGWLDDQLLFYSLNHSLI